VKAPAGDPEARLEARLRGIERTVVAIFRTLTPTDPRSLPDPHAGDDPKRVPIRMRRDVRARWREIGARRVVPIAAAQYVRRKGNHARTETHWGDTWGRS
jgi:hypothetical protein